MRRRVGGPPPAAAVTLRGVVVRFQSAGESAVAHTDRHGRSARARVIHVPRPGRLRLVVNIK